jgi:hypothetical protein
MPCRYPFLLDQLYYIWRRVQVVRWPYAYISVLFFSQCLSLPSSVLHTFLTLLSRSACFTLRLLLYLITLNCMKCANRDTLRYVMFFIPLWLSLDRQYSPYHFMLRHTQSGKQRTAHRPKFIILCVLLVGSLCLVRWSAVSSLQVITPLFRHVYFQEL